ncbi:hypothetical protein L9F63_013937, partial [Diploptera punctata]
NNMKDSSSLEEIMGEELDSNIKLKLLNIESFKVPITLEGLDKFRDVHVIELLFNEAKNKNQQFHLGNLLKFIQAHDITEQDTKDAVFERKLVDKNISPENLSSDFQADILRSEFQGQLIRGNRGFEVVLVDEVDSMLFDQRSQNDQQNIEEQIKKNLRPLSPDEEINKAEYEMLSAKSFDFAIDAAFYYQRDKHYAVEGEKIVPINYNDTGVFQPNMVWGNGLTQFLQIKEGTLGKDSTQEFFKHVYETDQLIQVHEYCEDNILIYTGRKGENFPRRNVSPGEIVIATNIAGRELKKNRDQHEAKLLKKAQGDIGNIKLQDELFTSQLHEMEEHMLLQKEFEREKEAITDEKSFRLNIPLPSEIQNNTSSVENG